MSAGILPDVPLVLTAHGINSGGEWQESVESTLHPHFEFRHYKYGDYRVAGFLRQYISLRLGLCALAVLSLFAWKLLEGNVVDSLSRGSVLQQRFRYPRLFDGWGSAIAIFTSIYFSTSKRLANNAARLPVIIICGVTALELEPWPIRLSWLNAAMIVGIVALIAATADRDPWLSRISLLRRISDQCQSFAIPLGITALAAIGANRVVMAGGLDWHSPWTGASLLALGFLGFAVASIWFARIQRRHRALRV